MELEQSELHVDCLSIQVPLFVILQLKGTQMAHLGWVAQLR